jgi:monoamine oxidase
MYDHSSEADREFALRGFLDPSFQSLPRAGRKERILGQISKYYGKAAEAYTGYHEQVWSGEAFTYAPYEQAVLPHQNNGHSIYEKWYLRGKLLIAGSETARGFPGYMEGAVRSARFVYEQLLEKI